MPENVSLHSKVVHESVKENLNEGNEKAEDEIKVNHLDVRSGRQAVSELNIMLIATYMSGIPNSSNMSFYV